MQGRGSGIVLAMLVGAMMVAEVGMVSSSSILESGVAIMPAAEEEEFVEVKELST